MVLGIEVAIVREKWLLSCLSRRVGWNLDVRKRDAYLADMQLQFEYLKK
jgi:hypothetical protein